MQVPEYNVSELIVFSFDCAQQHCHSVTKENVKSIFVKLLIADVNKVDLIFSNVILSRSAVLIPTISNNNSNINIKHNLQNWRVIDPISIIQFQFLIENMPNVDPLLEAQEIGSPKEWQEGAWSCLMNKTFENLKEIK